MSERERDTGTVNGVWAVTVSLFSAVLQGRLALRSSPQGTQFLEVR